MATCYLRTILSLNYLNDSVNKNLLFDVLTLDLLCFSLKLVYLHYHGYKYTETA